MHLFIKEAGMKDLFGDVIHQYSDYLIVLENHIAKTEQENE